MKIKKYKSLNNVNKKQTILKLSKMKSINLLLLKAHCCKENARNTERGISEISSESSRILTKYVSHSIRAHFFRCETLVANYRSEPVCGIFLLNSCIALVYKQRSVAHWFHRIRELNQLKSDKKNDDFFKN